MKVSVIVPTLNNKTLGAVLEAIQAQTTSPDEIIVVGRDSIGTVKKFPQVRFVDSQKPLCAAAVRNMGMLAANGDIFLFTDADCLPDKNWVAKHIYHQELGKMVVGGGIEIDSTNFWTRCDNLSMFHDYAILKEPGKRILLPTLNLSVRREVWEQVGGLDESFPGAAGEDSDWTIRMSKAGFQLHFEPSAVVQHAPERTTWQDVVRHWRNSGYNNIRVRIRHSDTFKTPTWAMNRFMLGLLSPIIAARITAGIFAQRRFWQYLPTAPIVLATKLIYCWSAARSIKDGYAFE